MKNNINEKLQNKKMRLNFYELEFEQIYIEQEKAMERLAQINEDFINCEISPLQHKLNFNAQTKLIKNLLEIISNNNQIRITLQEEIQTMEESKNGAQYV